MKKGNPKALLPILVFLVLYLGFGIIFEYVLKIPMGFYNIPIVVVFLVALLVACIQNPRLDLNQKIALMGKGVGDPNIMTMILIFMMAGIFVGVVGRSSANSVAYFILSIICIGSVMGGAMFGDNLSFISDTTIAACQGQGCELKDKFRENFKIALPAAIVTLVLTLVLSLSSYQGGAVIESYDLIQIIPYILVLLGGIIGINVFVVLLIGIVSGAIIMLATGAIAPTELLGNMGSGAAGMFETTMVAILVSAICALIREHGGFDAGCLGADQAIGVGAVADHQRDLSAVDHAAFLRVQDGLQVGAAARNEHGDAALFIRHGASLPAFAAAAAACLPRCCPRSRSTGKQRL